VQRTERATGDETESWTATPRDLERRGVTAAFTPSKLRVRPQYGLLESRAGLTAAVGKRYGCQGLGGQRG